MKGLFYFNHDNNARNDKKIQRIMLKYGVEGYGLYFLLLEEMHKSDGYFSLDDIDLFAWSIHGDQEQLRKIIDTMIEIGLFHRTDDDKIYSVRMKNDIDEYQQKSEKGKAMAEARHNKNTETSNTSSNNAVMHESETSNTDNNNAVVLETVSSNNAVMHKATASNNAVMHESEISITKRKEKKREEKKITTTEKKSNDVVATPPTQSVTTCNESVTDCHQSEQLTDAQLAGAMALLDSIGIDIDSPPHEEAAANDNDSILIDDNAVFNPDDNVGDYNTLRQQEADIDDKARIRDTLINTYHVSESVADVELAMHEVQYIQSKIDLLSKQKGINNPGAWLLKAIENDYQAAAVPEEKPLPQQTKTFSDNQYERFCQHFQQVYKHEFDQRVLYESAANILGSESKVDYLLTVINDYRGDQRIVDIFKVNHLACFADLLRSETAMGAMIGFGMAQSSKDMAECVNNNLPWMQQDKQGA